MKSLFVFPTSNCDNKNVPSANWWFKWAKLCTFLVYIYLHDAVFTPTFSKEPPIEVCKSSTKSIEFIRPIPLLFSGLLRHQPFPIPLSYLHTFQYALFELIWLCEWFFGIRVSTIIIQYPTEQSFFPHLAGKAIFTLWHDFQFKLIYFFAQHRQFKLVFTNTHYNMLM